MPPASGGSAAVDRREPTLLNIATRKAATVVATKLTTATYGEQLKTGAVKKCRMALPSPEAPDHARIGAIGAVGTSGVTAGC